MDRRQIALKLVLTELDIPSGMQTFDDRLILQKAIYLAQQAGVALGYHYGWYLRGPYSRDLTADAFEVTTEADFLANWKLDPATNATLARLKTFFGEIKNMDFPAKKFELLASVLFSIVTKQADPNAPETILARMKASGKPFDEKDISYALETLQKHAFLGV